jgi:hypothetical protein
MLGTDVGVQEFFYYWFSITVYNVMEPKMYNNTMPHVKSNVCIQVA